MKGDGAKSELGDFGLEAGKVLCNIGFFPRGQSRSLSSGWGAVAARSWQVLTKLRSCMDPIAGIRSRAVFVVMVSHMFRYVRMIWRCHGISIGIKKKVVFRWRWSSSPVALAVQGANTRQRLAIPHELDMYRD